MKRYRQLIRARKWELDGLRRALAELEAMRADIEARIDKLDRNLVEEQMLAARSNMLGDFGSYAQAAKQRRNAYLASIEELAVRIAAKHDEVRTAFQDLKTIEIAAERIAKLALQTEKRREQALIDDIAITRHQRQAVS